jgi:hypothetical protein
MYFRRDCQDSDSHGLIVFVLNEVIVKITFKNFLSEKKFQRAVDGLGVALARHFPGDHSRINSQLFTQQVIASEEACVQRSAELDEECGFAVFRLRRDAQVDCAFKLLVEGYGLRVARTNVKAFVDTWQPTASRPNVSVERRYEVEQSGGRTGTERAALMTLGFVEKFRGTLSQSDVELIVDNILFAHPDFAERIRCSAGIVATGLINRQTDQSAWGVRILEAFEGSGFTYSRVSLAKALLQGWGTPIDLVRARRLLELMLDKHGDPKVVAQSMSTEEAGPANLKLALAMCERAAELGDGESALHAHLFYSPKSDPNGVYYGVVAPDEERSAYYYALAVRHGYVPHLDQFAWEVQ